jgi:uncharacterized protein involved in exopolysaccharide biosynthesis
MDKYLDLREYLRVIIKYRIFIGAVFVVSVVAATVFSLLQTPIYTASALVAITRPTYELRFDPRFSTLPPQLQNVMSIQAIKTLVRSTELKRKVIEENDLTSPGGEPQLMEDLDKMVKVSAVGGGNLYAIEAKAEEPKKAAQIANSWAKLFAQHMNGLFGTSGPQGFIEKQLEDADKELKRAEAAYIEFQETNQIALLKKKIEAKTSALASYLNTHESGRSTVLSQEIAAKTNALSTYLAARNNIRLVRQDAENLKNQLKLGGETSNETVNSLPTLLLEIGSLNSSPKLPIQLQIPMNEKTLGASTTSQQIQALDGLITTLKAKEQIASAEIERISSELIKLKGLDFLSTPSPEGDPVATQISKTYSEILSLQGELARQQVQADRLNLARSTAKATYQTLSNKLDEAKITAATSGPVRVISQAIEPRWPTSPKKRTNVAVGALLGLFVGIAGSFIWEYVLKPNSK